jgi:hypothetical protein
MTIIHPTSMFPIMSSESFPLVTLIDASVLRRAGIVALVLGSILALANQSGAIFGELRLEILQLVLVYLTPFVVVTISQVLGIRRALRDIRAGAGHAARGGSFLATVNSHGIPFRALVLGLIVVVISTSIAAATTFLEFGTLADLAMTPIVQAFVLPMLFSLLSQAISYRRVTTTVNTWNQEN